jgi:hypothetical protein
LRLAATRAASCCCCCCSRADGNGQYWYLPRIRGYNGGTTGACYVHIMSLGALTCCSHLQGSGMRFTQLWSMHCSRGAVGLQVAIELRACYVMLCYHQHGLSSSLCWGSCCCSGEDATPTERGPVSTWSWFAMPHIDCGFGRVCNQFTGNVSGPCMMAIIPHIPTW